MSTDCTCTKCVEACEQRPGWFAPGEAEKAAKYMGMDFDQFKKKYLVIDHCDNHYVDNAPYIYSPRKKEIKYPKDLINNHYTQLTEGKCIFLNRQRCMIHEVKPYECKNSMACDFKWGLRDKIEQMWIEAGSPLGMRPESV